MMIEIIEDPKFKMITHVRHGFFTRHGGVSSGYYASLNCCDLSKDDPLNVKENRRRALAVLGYPLESLATTKNVHSNGIAVVDPSWKNRQAPIADGMVTNHPGIVLGSDSADCPIVLLADATSKVIGLSHAGWRSAKQNIIEETIEKMISLGAKPNNISAVIGPSIMQDSYEIDLQFYHTFLQDTLDNHIYFKPTKKKNHFLFDLRKYVRDRLLKLKIKMVAMIDLDTYTDNRFFSCRLASHKGEPDFGGHLSCITLL